MFLSYCSRRRDRTRHASAVRLSFLLFSAERFLSSKVAPLKVSIAAETTSLRVAPAFPFMPMLIQSQLVVAAAFSIRFYFLVRLGRSSSLCPSQTLVDALLAPPLLYYHPLFSHLHFVLYYLGYRFTCYRSTLCSTTSRSFEIFPSTATFFVHSFHMVTSPPLRPLVSDFISFSRSTCCLIAFYVSCLEAPLDLCGFAFEALTS